MPFAFPSQLRQGSVGVGAAASYQPSGAPRRSCNLGELIRAIVHAFWGICTQSLEASGLGATRLLVVLASSPGMQPCVFAVKLLNCVLHGGRAASESLEALVLRVNGRADVSPLKGRLCLPPLPAASCVWHCRSAHMGPALVFVRYLPPEVIS